MKKKTLETIRKNCTRGRRGIEGKHIYLVSNRATTRWDFPFVRETLVTDFPKRKQDALVLSLRLAIGDRRNMILLKKDALQRRIAKISLASAAGGAIPIPGVCALFDIPTIWCESLVYRRQLGLDSGSIQKISSQSGIDLESLTTIASMAKKYTPDLLLKTFGTSAVGYVARDVVKVIPILGIIVGGLLSYDLCREILSHILDDYTLVALSMNEYIYRHLKGEKCDVKEFMAKNKMPIEELTEDKVESAQDAKGAYELPEASTETTEKSSEYYVEKGISDETTSLKDQNMPSGEIAGAVTEDNIESVKDAKPSDERREVSTETNEKASDHGEEKGTSEETTSLKDQNTPSGEIAGAVAEANETSSEHYLEKGTSEEIASLRNQTMTNENEMASSEIRHAHQIKCFQFI